MSCSSASSWRQVGKFAAATETLKQGGGANAGSAARKLMQFAQQFHVRAVCGPQRVGQWNLAGHIRIVQQQADGLAAEGSSLVCRVLAAATGCAPRGAGFGSCAGVWCAGPPVINASSRSRGRPTQRGQFFSQQFAIYAVRQLDQQGLCQCGETSLVCQVVEVEVAASANRS